MLSPDEFTVGKVGSAKPLSLVLPANKYGETILIGRSNDVATAVFLSDQHQALSFESEGNENWEGLIIPDVRIEIDETSWVDPYRSDPPVLSVLRTDTKLVIAAKIENSFGRSKLVTLHDNLLSAGNFQAAFTKWQVVVGEGENKRIMWTAA